MARLPRYVVPGQPQHIIQRGNNRQVIFAAEADYQFFRDALIEAAKQHGLIIHAYVWMTNHIHLLATPLFEHSISKVFQSVVENMYNILTLRINEAAPYGKGAIVQRWWIVSVTC